MLIRVPPLEATQIEEWMRQGAERNHLADAGPDEARRAISTSSSDFNFKKARQALQRARAKSSPKTMKPLRRLRTNQAAVNESVTDALSALITVNKAMASELTALGAELAELRARLEKKTR